MSALNELCHLHGVRAGMPTGSSNTGLNQQKQSLFFAALPAALLVAVLVWADWPTWRWLVSNWLDSPQYSHGLLVLPFIGWLFWSRRDVLPAIDRIAPVSGLICLIVGACARILGGVMDLNWLCGFAIVLTTFGGVFLLAGPGTARWALPGLLFFLLAVPLPYRVEIMLGFPLQQMATTASTYVLQTLGLPAVAEGHTILIRDFKLEIVQACSGLRMLMTFITFSTAVCLASRRPFADKLIIMLSAIPIALATNILRIVVTGIMFMNVSSEQASAFFHDAAGWFMMPVALAFLGVELLILQRLFVEIRTRPAFR